MSPTASSTPLPSPTPLVPWRPRATVAPDSNKLKHSRGTKKISAPLASTPACPASGRQNLHNLLATNHAQPPLTRPPPRQPQWVRHPPASARAPTPASCLPSRNESPSLLFLPLLVSSRGFSLRAVSPCLFLPAFLSFPFLCLGLPSSRRTVLPSTAACQAHRTILPPTHPRRRLRKKQHFPIAASVARHRTAQPTSCASNGCGERG